MYNEMISASFYGFYLSWKILILTKKKAGLHSYLRTSIADPKKAVRGVKELLGPAFFLESRHFINHTTSVQIVSRIQSGTEKEIKPGLNTSQVLARI
jgi:hypothetical protein